MDFKYTIKILGLEIKRIGLLEKNYKTYPPYQVVDLQMKRIKELQAVIKILQEGQAYLRKEKPIGVRFFRDL